MTEPQKMIGFVGNVEVYLSVSPKEKSMRKEKVCRICNISFIQHELYKRRTCPLCRRLKRSKERLSKIENPNAKQRAKIHGHGKGCNGCNTIKTDTDFNKMKNFCKSCESLYNKKMAKKHWKKTYARRKERIKQMKLGAINRHPVQLVQL